MHHETMVHDPWCNDSWNHGIINHNSWFVIPWFHGSSEHCVMSRAHDTFNHPGQGYGSCFIIHDSWNHGIMNGESCITTYDSMISCIMESRLVNHDSMIHEMINHQFMIHGFLIHEFTIHDSWIRISCRVFTLRRRRRREKLRFWVFQSPNP